MTERIAKKLVFLFILVVFITLDIKKQALADRIGKTENCQKLGFNILGLVNPTSTSSYELTSTPDARVLNVRFFVFFLQYSGC